MSSAGRDRLSARRGRNRENESWIYSYADLITNLLALFIMFLVISSGDLRASNSKSSHIDQRTLSNKQSVRQLAQKMESKEFLHIKDQAQGGLPSLTQPLDVLSDDEGLKVSFGGEMLFSSGSSELRSESLPVLARISALLQTLPPGIVMDVEGHSDSTPTRSGRYPSNWELSSARAGSVVRAFEDFGFPPERMRAIGLADTKPAQSKDDHKSNRRVVLRIRLSNEGEL